MHKIFYPIHKRKASTLHRKKHKKTAGRRRTERFDWKRRHPTFLMKAATLQNLFSDRWRFFEKDLRGRVVHFELLRDQRMDHLGDCRDGRLDISVISARIRFLHSGTGHFL